MAASGNASLTSLLKKASLDDHEQLLRASESALKASKNDLQAQHVKAVSLLRLDKYDEAVAFFEASGNVLKEQAAVEYAYALYKVGKLEQAADAASKIRDKRGAQHVEAQARYKLEEFAQTAQIYKSIRMADVPTEEFDIRVNQGAIDAQGQWLGLLKPTAVKKAGREDLEAFETAYNAACGSIARGELAQAEILLKRAKELCKHSDDLVDAQKKEELMPIIVQQSYVLHRQGKTTEAKAIADEIMLDDIPDLFIRKVASSNLLLSSDGQSNPFLAHKIFNSTPSLPNSDRLFSYQSIPLASNERTIDLKSFKFNGLAETSRKKLTKSPSTTTSSEALLLSAFNAAALARNDIGKTAINNVLPELARRPNDVGLVITLIQMYILVGNTTSAIELVESLFKRLESSPKKDEQELRYHPGLIGIAVALYRQQGRKSQVKQELAESASHWRKNPQPPVSLLRAAGVSLLESSSTTDIKTAADIFDKLYEQQPDDKATIAGYIASRAVSDPDSVKSLTEKLTPVSKLVSNIDTDTLESHGIPQSTNALAIAQAKSGRSSRKRTAPTDDSTRTSKRIRKSRLPKDYDPTSNTKPDPERWLPLRDRSSYRPPKGKKKGRKGGGGDDRTQGGVVSEDLDVSKQTQTKGGEVVTGNTAGGGGGKKRKGKSKK